MWITRQTLQTGTTDGLRGRTTTRSMDYFRMMNLEKTTHNKKHKLPTYKTPVLPTQQEIDEHNITHLPYRDWCKHCVQGKSESQHHQRGGLTKQSITQIDYAYLKSDNDKHYAT
eukprot:2928613-Amphidinium_carterae.1